MCGPGKSGRSTALHIEAKDLLNALRLQAAARGAFADIIMIDSIIDYEAAQKYLQAYGPVPMSHGTQAPAPAASDEAYPNEQEWHRCLAEDRQKALQSLHQLELQRARFGLSAPPLLDASIAAFRRAAHNPTGNGDSPEART
jgi:hypothetical protein